MRAVVQRVIDASVVVEGEVVGQIDRGLLVYLGVMEGDGEEDLDYLVRKCAGLRVFRDEAGKMNRDVEGVAGGVLVVSQFTLAADTRKGRRPSFVRAADPAIAIRTVDWFVQMLRSRGLDVATGRFGADMSVRATNDGPVTIWLDSSERPGAS